MRFELTNEEAQTFTGLLQDHLPNLKREAAATNLGAHELKRELNKRVALCERLLAEANAPVATAGGRR